MLLIQIIVLQVVVFGAVIFFLKRILYRDTESSINRLDRVYQDMLKKQKELTQKIEAAEKEYGEKKEEATLISSKLKTEAMEEVRLKQDDVIKKAKAEAEELVRKAHESTAAHQKEIEKKLRRELIDESAKLLGLVFSEKTAEALHRELVKEFLERTKAFDLSTVGAHIVTLNIKSALPLSNEALKPFEALITSKINRAIKIETSTDKALIAGIVLQFGTLLLDGSLVNYIREASEKSKENLQLEG